MHDRVPTVKPTGTAARPFYFPLSKGGRQYGLLLLLLLLDVIRFNLLHSHPKEVLGSGRQ